MMKACQVSSFLEVIWIYFKFKAIILKNNSFYALKLPNEVRNIWNFSMLVWMLNANHIKSLGVKYLRITWCICDVIVSNRNPDTSKWMARFVKEGYLIFLVIHWNFYHGPCWWNDDIMPSLVFFRALLKLFSIWR